MVAHVQQQVQVRHITVIAALGILEPTVKYVNTKFTRILNITILIFQNYLFNITKIIN